MLLHGALAGCVSTRYKLARPGAPPLQRLDVPFEPSPPVQASLVALIVYRGPGTWKREALWDEYVVALRNDGSEPVTLEAATLADAGDKPFDAGANAWALEKTSRKLEKQYRRQGQAFARNAAAGVAIVAAGTAIGSATAGATATVVPGAAAGMAVATVVVLPVYYISVWSIDRHNRKHVEAEFARRTLVLPLTLAPGEARTGSLFFPMVRSPRLLSLRWSARTRAEEGAGEAKLPLGFLGGLHVAQKAGGGRER
ncbi:MAG: hypothetical protein U1F11_05220 [Steroidobacteraceae bacterium]